MHRANPMVMAVLLVVPIAAMGQGQSPIEVTAIMASPGSFAVGAEVTFSLQIKNLSTHRTKTGTAYVDVFKGDGLLPSDHLWGATQDVLRIDPGGTTVVDFVWRNELRGSARARAWTVPDVNTDVFVVRAGVLELSSDRARMKIARFERKCTYTRLKPITDSPLITLTDLKRLSRPTPK